MQNQAGLRAFKHAARDIADQCLLAAVGSERLMRSAPAVMAYRNTQDASSAPRLYG